MDHAPLTAVQEDYLEAICRLGTESGPDGIRISDIAGSLGTRLPTVTRTVRRLVELGLLHHPLRGRVGLSSRGRKMAVEIVHRHEDTVRFFVEVLGVSPTNAERDACQIEHGISAGTAQRMHDFLEHFNALSRSDRQKMTAFRKDEQNKTEKFRTLTRLRVNGWRT
jgi:DtxR family transcriptional regulator, Mn-dependent transcriptional regulator